MHALQNSNYEHASVFTTCNRSLLHFIYCLFLYMQRTCCMYTQLSLYMTDKLAYMPAHEALFCVHPCFSVRLLTSTRLYARHVERHHQGSGEDSEARNHVPRGLPGGGSNHEEASARQAGAALRRRVWGAHLHYHWVHEPRYRVE